MGWERKESTLQKKNGREKKKRGKTGGELRVPLPRLGLHHPVVKR